MSVLNNFRQGSIWSDGAATPAAKALTVAYVAGDEIFWAMPGLLLSVHCQISGTAPTSVDLQLEQSFDNATWEVVPIPGNESITADGILRFILTDRAYYRFSAKRTGGAADTALLALGYSTSMEAFPGTLDQDGALVISTGATGTVSVEGNVAHDAADAGNPVKIGGHAATSTPAAVANNDRVNAYFDEYGRLHVFDENGSSAAAGDVAHDAVDSGNPVKVGFRARTSQIAAVANDDRSDAISTAYGEQVNAGYDWTLTSNRSNETNPLSEQYASDEFEEATIASGGTAYHYIDMAGYAHLTITGNNTPGTDGQTITLEATCQDDGTAPGSIAAADWMDITQYGVDWLTGAAAASNTTGNFGWAVVDAARFKYVRIKYVTGAGAGNDAAHDIYTRLTAL